MLERLGNHRSAIAWIVLALGAAWTVWRVFAALTADGPIGVVADYAPSLFTIVHALPLVIVAVCLVLEEPLPRRAVWFLYVALGFGVAATLIAVVFQMIGQISPVLPEPVPVRVVGLIGFTVLQAIPTLLLWALWRLCRRARAGDIEEVREMFGRELSREDLIQGADEPTRRIHR